MKKHIVCFGDSNTHGYCADPADSADGGKRFNEDERWTCLIQAMLGAQYHVIEEGMSGRTTVFADPLREGIDGLSVLYPILKSHETVDLLIIMLGTNDTKQRFGVGAANIARGMERLVRKAMQTDCWGEGAPNILIVAPPVLLPTVCDADMGEGCVPKSRALAAAYRAVAQQLGCHFLDAQGCAFSPIDGMHLTRQGHRQLAERLAARIPSLLA